MDPINKMERRRKRRAWLWVGALIGFLVPVALVAFLVDAPSPFEAGRMAGRIAFYTGILGAVVGLIARRFVPFEETSKDIDADFR